MQKYTRTRNRFHSASSAGSRFLTILLIIAVFAAGFLISKLTIGNTNQQEQYQVQLHQQIRNEAKNALTYVSRLSRNNGTSSDYTTVAVVKQNLHCIEVLNTLLVSSYGENARIFTADELSVAINATDDFYSKLQSGTRVADSTDDLTALVEALYQKAVAVAGS